MKLALVCLNEPVKRPKKPIDHFKKCPACGDQDLILLNPDVLCSKCSWDSTSWHVSTGAMDNLQVAVNEFLAPVRRAKIKVIKSEPKEQEEDFFAKAQEL